MGLLASEKKRGWMFRVARTLDLDPDIEKDEEKLELEKDWIRKRKAGDLITTETKADSVISVIGVAIFGTLLFGSMLSIILIYIFPNFYSLFLGYLLVFTFFIFKLREPYSKLEFDLRSENFLYDGIMEFGGILRKVRYLGDIRIIEATQLVKKGKKSYLRFVTNSGYLRMHSPEDLPIAVRHRLDQLHLIPVKKFPTPKVKYKWKILAETKFDRSEYFESLREKRNKKSEKIRKRRTESLEEEYKKQSGES